MWRNVMNNTKWQPLFGHFTGQYLQILPTIVYCANNGDVEHFIALVWLRWFAGVMKWKAQ